VGLAVGGVIANIIATLFFLSNQASEGDDSIVGIAAVILGTLIAVSVLGLIIAGAGKKKLGGTLVIIGSIAFVPLGLIGVFGGRKIIQSNAGAHDLDMRRHMAPAASASQADSSRGG